MPIPDLTADGLLPDGLHECTIDEAIERFGRFQECDRRPVLGRELKQYVAELRSAGVGKYLVVDGSFVTSKPDPSDIDILLVLRDDVNTSDEFPPFQYNPRSKTYIRRNYHFDFFVGFDSHASTDNIIQLFRQVKYRPGEAKGMLKVAL